LQGDRRRAAVNPRGRLIQSHDQVGRVRVGYREAVERTIGRDTAGRGADAPVEVLRKPSRRRDVFDTQSLTDSRADVNDPVLIANDRYPALL
jgi:hypothetical protein